MTAKMLGLFLVGIVVPILTQWLKKGEVEGRKALYLTFAVSGAVAVVSMVATGEWPMVGTTGDPVALVDSLLKGVGVVFTLATLLYKTAKPGPSHPHGLPTTQPRI